MVRSGKISESPSKSVLKKAKRAAEKAKQDPAKGFSTSTDANINTPYLDAANVSSVCIPRNYNQTPASILAPPVLTAHDVSVTTLRAPPATVIIPAQLDPLPVQLTPDPIHDNLSIPTIRSCLNYETIPIKFSYLMDVEDYSSEDEMKSHIELLSENRRKHRRLA